MATARNPNTFSSKSILAQKVLLRASKTQAQSDILAAVSKWEPIASQIPKEHPDYEPVLSSYAVALLLKWEFTKDIKDIKKAIVTLEHALVSLEKAASRNRYQNLANLGAAYMDRWETFRTDGKDVLRAIECWEEAHTISMPLGLARESVSDYLGGAINQMANSALVQQDPTSSGRSLFYSLRYRSGLHRSRRALGQIFQNRHRLWPPRKEA